MILSHGFLLDRFLNPHLLYFVLRANNEAPKTNVVSVEEDSLPAVRPVPRRLMHRRPDSNEGSNSRNVQIVVKMIL